jgi:S-(hydroxymethyl)glutathione dehydrogenase / alcohol dehydrogenase
MSRGVAAGEPLRVRAAVWHGPREPASVEEVLLDPPQAGEVLVRVAAAGVCHSDLHLADGEIGEHRFPTVLGHEGAGVVEAVGDEVEHVAPGDRVALCFLPACGACRACLRGRRNLCEPVSAASFAGTMLDGSTRLRLPDGAPLKHFLAVACFAERCVVPARSAIPVPPALPLWQAALVGCAVVTGAGAVRNAAAVRPGDAVAVVGCGGVGLHVVAAARRAGADPVVAVDRAPEKLALALDQGATHAVDSRAERAAKEVRTLAGGGVDHAFEVVGRAETIRLAWETLRPGGTVVVVGLAPIGVDATVPAIDFLSEKTLRGSFYGSGDPVPEIAELALLAAAGELDLAGSVSRLTDLDGIEEALDRLRRGEGARTVAVLDPDAAGTPRPALQE